MPYAYRSSRAKFKKNTTNQRQRSNRRGPGASNIDPRRFVAAATLQELEVYQPTNTFEDFELLMLLQANLAAKGYTVPSPIQDQSIPAGLAGRDVLGMAGTGTGKTAAFALPVLQRLINDRNSSALIIAPTRELAQQIENECRALGKGSGLAGALLIGGSSMGTQLQQLRHAPRIVIGTPGRIKDHIERGTLKLQNFNVLVLDEVDRMLDMGFVADIRSIVSQTNPVRQSLFFSATMNPQIRRLIDDFSSDPVTVTIQTVAASESVHQDIVPYQGNSEKMDRLHDLLIKKDVTKAIIFDETQRGVERLHKELESRGFKSDSMHGGKTQGQRERALAKFKKSEVTILVATDVAARGIDVADITHVINYSVPKEYDDYIHRIGRAGRAGRIGYAFTFLPAN